MVKFGLELTVDRLSTTAHRSNGLPLKLRLTSMVYLNNNSFLQCCVGRDILRRTCKIDFTGHVTGIYDTTGGILPSVGIHSIYFAHDSSVWVGMFHGGVAVLDHGSWRYYTTANGLPDNDVFSITEKGDTIYVGTSGGGVAFFDGTRSLSLPTIGRGGIGGEYVHSLKATSSGILAGTFGYGIALWNGKTWTLIGPDTSSMNDRGPIFLDGIRSQRIPFLLVPTKETS